MKFDQDQQQFYDDCRAFLEEKHKDIRRFLPVLRRFVMATFKAEMLASEIMEADAVVRHTNKAGHTNDASSPKARMFAVFNKEAISLGRELGLYADKETKKEEEKPKVNEFKRPDKGTMKIA